MTYFTKNVNMYYVEYIITSSIYINNQNNMTMETFVFSECPTTVSFMIFDSFANFQNSKETCMCCI